MIQTGLCGHLDFRSSSQLSSKNLVVGLPKVYVSLETCEYLSEENKVD